MDKSCSYQSCVGRTNEGTFSVRPQPECQPRLVHPLAASVHSWDLSAVSLNVESDHLLGDNPWKDASHPFQPADVGPMRPSTYYERSLAPAPQTPRRTRPGSPGESGFTSHSLVSSSSSLVALESEHDTGDDVFFVGSRGPGGIRGRQFIAYPPVPGAFFEDDEVEFVLY